MKRTISLILIMMIGISSFNINIFSEGDWNEEQYYSTDKGGFMPFRPENKSTSYQNPPGFTWPYVNAADSYDLIVCNDSGMKNVLYRKDNIKYNYFCFDKTFESGIDLYWAVRYHAGETVSAWSDSRRFKIDPDASEFVVDDIARIVERVPSEHPRIWTTKNGLEDFRQNFKKNAAAEKAYNSVLSRAERYASSNSIPSEPTEQAAALSGASEITNMLTASAFAYLLTERQEFGDFAIRVLEAVSKWSWDDTSGTTSYRKNDQAHRMIAYRSAIAYDWLYDLLNETQYAEQKQLALKMIEGRAEKMAVLIESLSMNPYNSHGWTAFGHLGIIGVAMHGEIEKADEWLSGVIRLYSALVTPWSCQDGGWSQGTAYWQYSSVDCAELMEILSLAGIINLYNTAWMQNQYLWALYTYPEGSYGSFGDGSNIDKAEDGTDIARAMGGLAAFADNSAAKWLFEQVGGYTGSMSDYYVSVLNDKDSHIPSDYPLGHAFDDVGWAVMTDNLTDTDRIQLTFKSSPYGSFNHSHADQNSFIIQAYGEKLAVKSGYYDYYHSEHDNNITRKTFSHNSITADDGDGQGYYEEKNGGNDSLKTNGRLCQFVSQMSFDSVTGDATNAYVDSPAGNTKSLGKFVRSIIYVRPDVFVVIDDLAAKHGEQAQFKWWLNSDETMEYNNNSAVISKGHARLNADVIYPSDVTTKYYKGFYDLNGNYWQAGGNCAELKEQDRVAFSTEKCEKTKMVVSMSIHKDEDSAKKPKVTYSAEGACMRLEFEDGNTVLINLTEDDTAAFEGIAFKGTAVSYNGDSVLMTNGTYLEKNGVKLIEADRNATVALGCGQVCISCDDDTEISLNRNNEYLNINSVSLLRDNKQRFVSAKIGIAGADDNDSVLLSAQKGNYTLFAAANVPVSVQGLIPRDITLHKNAEGVLVAEWTENENCDYDISINGAVTENVSSPYLISDESDEISVSVRGKICSTVGEWSSPVCCSESEKAAAGSIDLPGDKNAFTAKTYVTGIPSNGILGLGVYDEQGRLIDFKSKCLTSGKNELEVSEFIGDKNKVRAFLWNGVKPLTQSANYTDDSTDLLGIYINGRLIDGFENLKEKYVVEIKENEYDRIPEITVVPSDGKTRTVISENPDKQEVNVKLISPEGRIRNITTSFVVEPKEFHAVYGAAENNAFQDDNKNETAADAEGKNDKISINNVGVFSYGEDTLDNSIDLKLYSGTKVNKGGELFGSRLCSDRSPRLVNRMEISHLCENLQNRDYFILPNDYYVNKRDQNNSAEMKFKIVQNAEIVVLSTKEINSLTDIGYSVSKDSFGGARYMNTVGAEDKYYNIHFNNRPANDFDSQGRLKNYDIAAEWIDVKPLKKYDSSTDSERDYTLEEYESEKPGAECFEIVKNSSKWIHGYNFQYKYSKKYNVKTDGEDVTLRLNDMTGRIIVIIKPIDPVGLIDDVEYLGPKSFEELDEALKNGCTDDTVKKNIAFYRQGLLKTNFAGGNEAFYDREEIININDDLPELEGAYYFPLSYNTVCGKGGYAWQKAFFFGMPQNEKYIYPEFDAKTHDWYSFNLNGSAYLYIVLSGESPEWVDSSWERINLNNPLFYTYGYRKNYRTVYRKYVNVKTGEKEHIIMKTPGIKSAYYLLIKSAE